MWRHRFLVVAFSLLAAGQISLAESQITGTPEVLVEDFPDGTSRTTVYLRLLDGSRVELTGVTPDQIGTCAPEVVVSGETRTSGKFRVTTLRAAAIIQPPGAISCGSTGEQKVAGVILQFPGVAPAMTKAQLQTSLFEGARSAKAYFEEVSYGKVSMTGDVYGPFTTDRAYSCDEWDAISKWTVTQLQSIIPFRNYNRVVIVVPVNGCASRGQLGCIRQSFLLSDWTATFSWLFGGVEISTTVHELGHNFGLSHSNSLTYSGKVLGDIGDDGKETEYGDRTSVMGSSSYNPGHVTASQRVQLGWIPEADVEVVENPGIYTIRSIQPGEGSGPRVLKVRRKAGVDHWFWIEYKVQFGFDGFLTLAESNGARINYSRPPQVWRGFALDFTPDSAAGMKDGLLSVGTSWTDSYTGRTIRVLNATTSALTVQISDTPTAPCLTLSPALRTLTGDAQTSEIGIVASPGCSWYLSSAPDWITLTTNRSGDSSANVGFRVSRNSGSTPRTGTVRVRDDMVFTVTQSGGGNAAPAFERLLVIPMSGGASIYPYFNDPNGNADLRRIKLLVSSSPSRISSCYVELDAQGGTVALAADNGTDWAGSGPVTSVAAGLSNSQCSVSNFHASPSGFVLQVLWKEGFSGDRRIYASAVDHSGLESDLQIGSTIAVSPNYPPTVVSMTPTSGFGTRVPLTLVLRDANGGADIRSIQLSFNGAKQCSIGATAAGLYASGSSSDSIPWGSSGTSVATGCSVEMSSASWTVSGDLVTVVIPITLTMDVTNGSLTFYDFGYSYGYRALPWRSSVSECVATIAPLPRRIPVEGGTYAFQVSAPPNCARGVSGATSWLTVATAAGSVTLTAAANSTPSVRSATLMTGATSFAVTQDAASSCTTTQAAGTTVIGARGGSGSVNLQSLCVWRAVSSADWLTILDDLSMSQNGLISWTAAPNPTVNARTATITAGGKAYQFQQAGSPAVCTYSVRQVDDRVIPSNATTRMVAVNTAPGCPRTAQSGSDWLMFEGGIWGNGPGTFKLRVTANTSAAPRTATVGVAHASLSLTQAAKCEITLGTTDNFAAPPEGQTRSLAVSGPGCVWEASSPAPWIQLFPLRGTAPATIQATIFPNFGDNRGSNVEIGGKSLHLNQFRSNYTKEERMLGLLYYNAMGRLATPLDVTFQLREGLFKGTSRTELVQRWFNNIEFNEYSRFTAGLYVGILNRDAEFGGWLFQRNAMRTQGISQLFLTRNFIDSAEFQLQHPSAGNSELVRTLYRQVLLREPTNAEVAFQAGALASGTPPHQLALNFLRAQEFQAGTGPRLTAFLIYSCLLGREPNALEMAAIVRELSAGVPVATLIDRIVFSSDFEALFSQ